MRKFDPESRQWWREIAALEMRDIERSDAASYSRCCALWMKVRYIQVYGQIHPVHHCPHCGKALREEL